MSIRNSLLLILSITFYISCTSLHQYERKDIRYVQQNSLVLTGYTDDAYSNRTIDTYLDELDLLGLNTASFLYSCLTDNKLSHNVDCSSSYSPSLASLALAIEKAKQRGFIVNVRHYIDLKTKDWRCEWKPQNAPKAIESIGEELVSFAKFLERRKVELFIIGAEYCELTAQKNQKLWNHNIANIRKVFSGKLTYAANSTQYIGKMEYLDVSFWRSLDYVGIDYYQPIPSGLTAKQITSFQKKQFERLAQFSDSLKKPLLITEMGFPGVSEGTSSPYEWRNKGKSDESRQAMAYRQTLAAIAQIPQIKGVYIWRKLAVNKELMTSYNPSATGYHLYQRKAWYEIQRSFASLNSFQFNAKNTFLEWNSGKVNLKDQSLAVQTKGLGEPLFFSIDISDKNLDLNKQNLYFELSINNLKQVAGLEVRFMASRSAENYYSYVFPLFSDFEFNLLKENEWMKWGISQGNLKLIGKRPNKLNYMMFYLNDKKQVVSLRLRTFETKKKQLPGIVSITFDDGHQTNLVAAKILKKHRLRATAYIMPTSTSYKDRLSTEEFKLLKEKFRWQVDSHHEIPFTSFDSPQLLIEINKIQDFLKRHHLKENQFHLAYPLGKTNASVISQVSKKFKTARAASGGMEVLPPGNLHMLRTYNVLHTTTVDQLIEQVEIAHKNQQWLILMFHVLTDHPKENIEFSIKKFRDFAKRLKALRVKTMTIDEVWKKYLK